MAHAPLCGDRGADDRRARRPRGPSNGAGLVRMDADGEPDAGQSAPDRDRRAATPSCRRREDAHAPLHPGRPRAPDDVAPGRRERLVREMAVAVDHRFSDASGPGCRARSS